MYMIRKQIYLKVFYCTYHFENVTLPIKLYYYINSSMSLQSNTKTTIKTVNGNTLATVSTPNILNCEESREFWVSWDEQSITVGKGRKA